MPDAQLTLPDAAFWNAVYTAKERAWDLDEQRSRWDAKAPSFAHKRSRSGYIDQLIERLGLEPGDTVFDMGCGSGTLSLPLAQAGHQVVSVDFSGGMLGELCALAQEEGVPCARFDGVGAPVDAPRIRTFQRAWQDSWDDLPVADVAVSSRSLITNDLEDAIGKLEAHARKRVAVTVSCGETPMCDLRMREVIGRPVDYVRLRGKYLAVLNFLLATGRMPTTAVIEHGHRWHAPTREALVEAAVSSVEVENDEERALLTAFVDEHLVDDPGSGEVTLDYQQRVRWAYVEWPVER